MKKPGESSNKINSISGQSLKVKIDAEEQRSSSTEKPRMQQLQPAEKTLEQSLNNWNLKKKKKFFLKNEEK